MSPITRKSKRHETDHDSTQTMAKFPQHTHTKFEALQHTIFTNYLSKRFSNKADRKKAIWATSFRAKSTKPWAYMYYNGVGGIRGLNFEWGSGGFDPPNYETVAYASLFKEMSPDLEDLNKADKSKAIKATWETMSKKEITKSIDQMPHCLNVVFGSQGQAIDDDYYIYCLNASEYQEYSKEPTK